MVRADSVGSRAAAVAGVVVLSVGYAAARPAFAGYEHFALVEFPAALLLVPLLLYLVAGRAREKPVEEPAWRRHEQVVRALPDPAAVAPRETLTEWLDRGARADAAARLLAGPRDEAFLADAARSAGTRKEREALLRRIVDEEGEEDR